MVSLGPLWEREVSWTASQIRRAVQAQALSLFRQTGGVDKHQFTESCEGSGVPEEDQLSIKGFWLFLDIVANVS